MTWLAVALFALTIPAANWLIGHVGDCAAGPCVIPVGFGLYAPSGVLVIGLALVLRDIVQHRAGFIAALGAVAAGSVISTFLAPPTLAMASGVAFLASEAADMAIYTPLARARRSVAVALSGVAGAAVDSALFLWLAFGSLDFVHGQVVGKIYASALAGLWIATLRAGDGTAGRRTRHE